ncbi:hypothetical protein [Latilactobacillus graminis]|nr:hypothetical protein [Latilactobacillus graminis]
MNVTDYSKIIMNLSDQDIVHTNISHSTNSMYIIIRDNSELFVLALSDHFGYKHSEDLSDIEGVDFDLSVELENLYSLDSTLEYVGVNEVFPYTQVGIESIEIGAISEDRLRAGVPAIINGVEVIENNKVLKVSYDDGVEYYTNYLPQTTMQQFAFDYIIDQATIQATNQNHGFIIRSGHELKEMFSEWLEDNKDNYLEINENIDDHLDDFIDIDLDDVNDSHYYAITCTDNPMYFVTFEYDSANELINKSSEVISRFSEQ